VLVVLEFELLEEVVLDDEVEPPPAPVVEVVDVVEVSAVSSFLVVQPATATIVTAATTREHSNRRGIGSMAPPRFSLPGTYRSARIRDAATKR
jgi:hypothetical protein